MVTELAELSQFVRFLSDVELSDTFPLHTPIIEKIEVTRRGKVRRAKLNYIRSLSAKAARIKERR